MVTSSSRPPAPTSAPGLTRAGSGRFDAQRFTRSKNPTAFRFRPSMGPMSWRGSNLVYRSASVVYDQLGIPLKGLRASPSVTISHGARFRVQFGLHRAGIIRQRPAGDKLTERQMPTLATVIEAILTTSRPCWAGDFVTSVIDEGQATASKRTLTRTRVCGVCARLSPADQQRRAGAARHGQP